MTALFIRKMQPRRAVLQAISAKVLPATCAVEENFIPSKIRTNVAMDTTDKYSKTKSVARVIMVVQVQLLWEMVTVAVVTYLILKTENRSVYVEDSTKSKNIFNS